MPKKLCNPGSIAVYESGYADGGAAYSQFAAICTHDFWLFRGHIVLPADPPQNNTRLLHRLLHFRGVPASSHISKDETLMILSFLIFLKEN